METYVKGKEYKIGTKLTSEEKKPRAAKGMKYSLTATDEKGVFEVVAKKGTSPAITSNYHPLTADDITKDFRDSVDNLESVEELKRLLAYDYSKDVQTRLDIKKETELDALAERYALLMGIPVKVAKSILDPDKPKPIS